MAAPSEDEKGLLRFENAARALFGADNAARGRASTFLAPYTASGSKIKQLIWVFENYEKVRFSCIYALTFAARALLKLITQFIDVKEEIKSPDSLRNWMIDQIFRSSRDFVQIAVYKETRFMLAASPIGRLVKIGWPKVYSLRTPTLLLEAYTNLKMNTPHHFNYSPVQNAPHTRRCNLSKYLSSMKSLCFIPVALEKCLVEVKIGSSSLP
eukprot:jgi/Bigna1/73613/fgenesh1_pg.25_\